MATKTGIPSRKRGSGGGTKTTPPKRSRPSATGWGKGTTFGTPKKRG